MRSAIQGIAVCLGFLVAGTASAWVVDDPAPDGGSRLAEASALGPDGNVVAVGWWYGPSAPGQDFRVAKYAASDGAELWNIGTGGLPSGSTAFASRVEIDAAGDVFVGGAAFTSSGLDVYDAIVVKLSGADGTVLWRRDFAGIDYQTLTALDLTSDGDAVVIVMEGPFFSMEPIVYRLDGATGTDAWATPLVIPPDSGGRAYSVVVDAADDVLCGAELPNGPGADKATVVKLDGTTGTETWRTVLADSAIFDELATDALGDVVAGGYADGPPPSGFHALVAKLATADGALLWRWDHSPAVNSGNVASVAVDAAGDVYAGGAQDDDLLGVKLDGSTGAQLWLRQLSGDYARAARVRLSPAGVPVFAGPLNNKFTLVSFAPATGATLWIEQLDDDQHDSGGVLDLEIGGGYLFATGTTSPSTSSQEDPQLAITVARYVDPSAPPIVGNCTPVPRTDCLATIEAGKSQLAVVHRPNTRGDKLKWKLAKGEATVPADFGKPLVAGNDYTLCLYDGTTAAVFSVVIPSGDTCGSVPCWRTIGTTGYDYRAARPRDPEGLDRLKLKAGPAGRTKIAVTRKGRVGIDIPTPAPSGFVLPLTVQLQQDGGNCFGATFAPAGVVKNDGVTFKARGE